MKAKLAPWLKETRGSSGETVFKQVNGETIMSSKPSKRKTPYSPDEIEVQERFLDARDYAKDVKLDPALLALYKEAAEAAGKSVYMLCRDDWYKPPRISRLEISDYNGQVGDVITFKVRDAIGAKKAIVTLSDDEEGTLIEKGLAALQIEGTTKWTYTATKPVQAGMTVRVQVQAYDYPGNMTEKTDTKKVYE